MTEVEKIAARTVSEIAFAYRTGESDPVTLTEYLLDRIERSRNENIFITVTAARAREEAAASAARYREGRARSIVDGVPIAWKDLFDVAGAPTTGASILYKETPAKERDRGCVVNAAAAGMVCLGKLNLTELAYSGLGLNPHFGTPVNPNDRHTHRSPGGSSSGSGVAVAAGLVPAAIGSDTGGSVRIPASFNGVVGFKTSEGRLDKTGMIPLSRTLDTVGPLCRSVTDCALIDRTLRGAIDSDVTRRDIRSLTLVAPTNVVFDRAEPEVVCNFDRALDALAKAGATVIRRRVSALDEVMEMTARHGTLAAAEAYHEYHDAIESEDVNRIDRRVVYRIVQGRAMSAYDLLSIQNGREAAIERLVGELGDALLVMPTTPIAAPEVAPLEADDTVFHDINLLTLRNAMLGNALRLCGLAVPNGRNGKGLPTSILFLGLHGSDDRLLGFGLEVESILAGMFEPAWAQH